ncbi:valine--tRNA ligase, partial [Candidatus Woesearchaeota archaeon]|nr:valine--tRNA ligase [Candidatus Woesearchaeota archaeon]
MDSYDPLKDEPKIQKQWEKEGIYSYNPKSEKPVFSIDTPPPTVSGQMHLGHALAYSQTDFIARYQRMKGKNVFYPFGFDDNGLPTERFIEKKLKIRARDMPRPKFVKLCLKETEETEKELKQDWSALGISPDWNLCYRTIDPYVTKLSQRSFLDLNKKKRVYRKKAPTIWCPTCQTAIAQVELEDHERPATFNDIIFKLETDDDLIIATTRPELLSSCVAIFYHPTDERYKSLKGKKATVPLFNYNVEIMEDERVDPEKGTGIVMCCTFGDQTDMEWYFAYNLELKESISKDGKMTKLAQKYQGLTIQEAKKAITNDLKQANLLTNQKPISQTVNVHERCQTPIEILSSKQWFIKYLDLKQDFLDAGDKLNWYPKHMQVRYNNWIKGLQWDWLISRQRFFGIPFPVWYCNKCQEPLFAQDNQLPVDPTTTQPKQTCPCGSKEFTPEQDILDTWATSSLTPQIATKWTEDEDFFKKMFPMSLRPNGHDIITFWL